MYKSEVFGKGCIYAKVVADSTANDKRITTLELNYPRFIHSEFMTHRMFSRNASSSRAIPVEKMLENISKEPAMPIFWGKNQPGMQAIEECDVLIPRGISHLTRETTWQAARASACLFAENFAQAGYHKQIVNRLTEPFQFIKVVVTATEWDNFFMLRLSPNAQPEIAELARCMKGAMYRSEPISLEEGEWHIPYISQREWEDSLEGDERGCYPAYETLVKCSVARCARVSYLNHDNTTPNIEKDVELHDKLLKAGHMSPFEHVATPMKTTKVLDEEMCEGWWLQAGVTHLDVSGNLWSGNFQGWSQFRQLVQE